MSRRAKGKTTNVVTDWATLRPPVTEALLADVTQRIVERFQPQKIVLFGSYAYGTPDLDSDVDLLVIMESEDSMAQRIRLVAEAAQVRFLPTDVLVYTPNEIKERLAQNDPFVKEILVRGKVLYERDGRG